MMYSSRSPPEVIRLKKMVWRSYFVIHNNITAVDVRNTPLSSVVCIFCIRRRCVEFTAVCRAGRPGGLVLVGPSK